MSAERLEALEPQQNTEGARGVALQPVLDIIDRVAIGYIALPRPDVAQACLPVIDAALALAAHAGPAVVFVPLPDDILVDPGFDALTHARARGAIPSEIVWTIRDAVGGTLLEFVRDRLEGFRDVGFRLALEGVSLAGLDRDLVAVIRPEYVFLDRRAPREFATDDAARAALSATVAYVSRLGGRLIVPDIADGTEALAVAGLGVQYGVGVHLAPPVVLDPELAAEGDEVVSESWFRSRDVRVIEERGAQLHAPLVLTPLPSHADANIDAGTFARLLGEAARTLQAEHDSDRIVRMAADLLLRTMPADRLAIFEADWERQRLVPRVAAGVGMEGLAGMDNSITEGITGWAFSEGIPYNCADTDRHPAAATIPGTERVEESLLTIPLVAGDHRLGVLDLWRDGLNRFSAEDLERCSLIGYIVSAAWRNAQLYAELERRAFTDGLTGLLNHRWWNEIAPREAAQSLRTGSQIGVLLVDLDDFKSINDIAGHATGDAALRSVARALRLVMREGDAAVRYGGEEFILMLSNSGAEGALRVAEAVRAALAELPPPAPRLPRVTASIGLALYPEHGRTLDDVARAADIAMYEAKRGGGDAVAVARAETAA